MSSVILRARDRITLEYVAAKPILVGTFVTPEQDPVLDVGPIRVVEVGDETRRPSESHLAEAKLIAIEDQLANDPRSGLGGMFATVPVGGRVIVFPALPGDIVLVPVRAFVTIDVGAVAQVAVEPTSRGRVTNHVTTGAPPIAAPIGIALESRRGTADGTARVPVQII